MSTRTFVLRSVLCGLLALLLAACSLTSVAPQAPAPLAATESTPTPSPVAEATPVASAAQPIVGTLPGRLVYVDGGNLQLRADGRTTALTDDGTVSSPAWSPDGRRIAVVRRDEESFSNVYLLDDRGETVGQITDVERTAAPRSRESVHQVVWTDAPAWSPDGRTLLFLLQVRPSTDENADVPLYEYPLSIFEAPIRDDVEAPPRAGVLIRSEGPDFQQPAWSPDETYIAYVEAPRDPDEQRQVMVYDTQTERSRPYPGIPANSYDPVWSPDGAWLAYTAVVDGQTDVWVIGAPDGEREPEPVRLTTTGTARAAAWSPDGRSLAFVQIDEQGANVYVLQLERDNDALRAGAAEQITTSGTVDANSRASWAE